MENLISHASKRNSSNYKHPFAIFSFFCLLVVVFTLNFNSFSNSPSISLRKSESLHQEFLSFMSKYNKNYEPSEYHKRFKIFAENFEKIRNHNLKNKDFVLGVNKFADLTSEEFKGKYLPWRYNRHHPKRYPNIPKNLTYPQACDWRTLGAVSPVKEQGECVSGWAFSAAGAVEGVWEISGKQLFSLSTQELVDCSGEYGNNGCTGGIMDYGFEYIIDNGITSDAIYPYKAKQGICQEGLASNIVAQIDNYYDLPSNNQGYMLQIVANQPLSVAVEANQGAWQFYQGGILTGNCGNNLDHGVLIVGYNLTTMPNYWIVKNSWGPDWGESGYIRILIKGSSGLCGINMEASYPVISG